MMQFLWRFVDDLVGKGLEMTVMGQFFFYSALTLVPAALPLAILLASLITFGNFGERYELLAMKAAGISLLQIMRPLVVLVVIICGISFYFQNVIGPMAQEKLGTLLISVKQKSPELDIPEGAFYSDIPGYQIRVSRKDRKTGVLYDVLIYNLKDGAENAHIIYADSGKMELTADKQHLNLLLYSGELFENLKSQNVKSQNVPYRRESFSDKRSLIEFDSDFNMVDVNIMSNAASTKDMRSLQASIDSMEYVGDSIGRQYFRDVKNSTYSLGNRFTKEDSIKVEKIDITTINVDSIFETATLAQKQRVINAATSRSESLKSDFSFKNYSLDGNDNQIRRHKIEWHKKITISLSCLLFFFIGAPLGGIIRKGGLGMPVIISVLMFIIYYIIDNAGYKMARDGHWIVWTGMWLSSSILAALGIFVTYKSNKDSVVLNADAYTSFIKRFLGIRSVRNMIRKEVIIHDPNYELIPAKLNSLTETCKAYLQTHKLTKAPNYFKLWFGVNEDNDIKKINDKLENIVDELSNSHSATVVNLLNNYPIIPTASHLRPFRIYWLNSIIAVVLPLGLFFYIRIWIFRYRLSKDIGMIIKNNEQLLHVISEGKNL